MIAIGQKAAEAQADLPGAAAHYGALARLRATLEPKQAELQSLKDELGPLLHDASFSARSLRVPAMVAAGVIVVVLVLYLGSIALSGLFASHLPAWVAQACPKDAKLVGYIDVDRLRSTDLWDSLEDKMGKDHGMLGGIQTDLEPDDVAAFAVIGTGRGELFLVETKEDLALDELFKNPPKDSDVKEKHDIEYARQGSMLVAKIGKRRFLAGSAHPEDTFFDALKRIDKKETPELDDDLQQALDDVAGNDAYGATMNDGMPVAGLRAMGLGVDFGSKIAVDATLVFKKKRHAENFREDFAEMLEDAREKFKGAPAPIRRQMEDALDLAEGIRVRQSGSAVRLSGAWSTDDVEDLVPTGPGGFPGRGFF
jgi:hypothetical protein